MKKRISIIGTVGLPARYGGFETLAHNIVLGLKEKHDLTVYCSGKRYRKNERIKTFNGAQLKYINVEANGVQSVLYDTISILHALFNSDILLILGVPGAWILPFVRLFTKKRIIISIDGIEWKRAKWGLLARIYLRWAEKIAVRFSHIDISDNEAIQDYTSMRYGTVSRVIEYGSDHVNRIIPSPKDQELYPFLNKDYAVKVCRIEPENNVEMVLNAFANLRHKTIVIVGNWNASEYGKRLKLNYNGYQNITLLDPIYESHNINVIRSNASLYIHGHSAGGTNPSLVEAMYLGLPILCYGVSYNRVTTEGQALYFESEKTLINQVNSIDFNNLNYYGDLMSKIAKRRYLWEIVTRKYDQLFQEVQHINKKTSIVPTTAHVDQNGLGRIQATHLAHTKFIFEE